MALKRTEFKRTPDAKPLARGSGLSRGSSTLARRTRLAPVSDRRKAEADEWAAVKAAVWLRDEGRCRAAPLVPEVGCDGTLHPHHRHPVGAGGARLAVGNVVLACARHHYWIHQEDPVRARVVGLLV